MHLQKVSFIKMKLIFCLFLFWNYLNKHESVTLSPSDSWVSVRDFDPMLLMIVVLIAMFLCSAFSCTSPIRVYVIFVTLCTTELFSTFENYVLLKLRLSSVILHRKTVLCYHVFIIFWRTPALDSSLISVYLTGWYIIVYFRLEKVNEHSRNIRVEW